MFYRAVKKNDELVGTRYDFYSVDDDNDEWELGYASMSNFGDWLGRFDTKRVEFSTESELDSFARKHGYTPLEITDRCEYGISFDNGMTFESAYEASDRIEDDDTWDMVVNFMEPHVRESVHDDIAPCTRAEFLGEYLNRCGALVIG